MCTVTIMRTSLQEWFGTLCRWPYRHCGPRLPVNSRIYDPPLGPETGKFRDRQGAALSKAGSSNRRSTILPKFAATESS